MSNDYEKTDVKKPIFIDSNELLELPIFVTREPVSQAKLHDSAKPDSDT